MTARLAALGLLFAVALAPAGARAQTLEDARRLYLAASFQDAVPAFEAVLADGDAARGEILEAHRQQENLPAASLTTSAQNVALVMSSRLDGS